MTSLFRACSVVAFLVSAMSMEAPAMAVEFSSDLEARFSQALEAAGFGDKHEALRAAVKPSVALAEKGSATGSTGTSRVGGGPDLPEGIEWPRDASGFHLNFLAQVDVGKLPDRLEPLPASGLLSFFIGTDMTDGTVLYSEGGSKLVGHALADDAEDISASAFQMVVWNSDKKRFVADGTSVDGLVAQTDADGRITFLREGKPVIALASQYDISLSPQELQTANSLSAPSDSPLYEAAGVDDPYPFFEALNEAVAIGDGPQHQMFGVAGSRGLEDVISRAVEHAAAQGWNDLTDAKDWFLLLKLDSGGAAGFSFGDAEDLIFLANRKDTTRGIFARVVAFLDQG